MLERNDVEQMRKLASRVLWVVFLCAFAAAFIYLPAKASNCCDCDMPPVWAVWQPSAASVLKLDLGSLPSIPPPLQTVAPRLGAPEPHGRNPRFARADLWVFTGVFIVGLVGIRRRIVDRRSTWANTPQTSTSNDLQIL
jgi:hypothetical protein